MTLERRLIKKLKRTIFSRDNLSYIGIDLIKIKYDPKTLAELVKKEGLTQRVGYLTEVCAEASKASNLFDYYNRLTNLYKFLEGDFQEWHHLHPCLPEWGRAVMKDKKSRSNLNEKWKVYSTLISEEIEDFIDLYVTRDYLHFTPVQRYEMKRRGVRYTKLLRNGKTKAG